MCNELLSWCLSVGHCPPAALNSSSVATKSPKAALNGPMTGQQNQWLRNLDFWRKVCIWASASLSVSALPLVWCYHGMSNLFVTSAAAEDSQLSVQEISCWPPLHPGKTNHFKRRSFVKMGPEMGTLSHSQNNKKPGEEKVPKISSPNTTPNIQLFQCWTFQPFAMARLITWCSRAQGKEFASYSKNVGNGRKSHPRAASR